jgi:Kef-type K+ transport system membrane component KefB
MISELWWMVEIATLIALSRMSEIVLSKVGMPKVMGYILVGMAIPLMNYELTEITSSLAVLGIVVYLFYLGLEGSLRGFIKGLKDAGLIAIGGVVASMVLPIAVLAPLGTSLKEAFALGVALSATSVTLTLKTLGDMGYEGSRVGQAITGAAVVDDVLGLALLSTVYSLEAREFPAMTLVEIVSGAFGFWLAVSYSLERLGKPMIKLALKTPMEEPLLSVIFIVLLVLSYIAAQLQLSAILLAYAVGLGFSRYRYEARYVSNRMLTLIALFTPLFFVKAGSLVDIRIIFNALTPSLIVTLTS